MRGDTDIRRDVEAELHWSPKVDHTDIAVKVLGGVVVLLGFVRNYSERFEAEIAAKRVVGVTGIANDIEVRMPLGEGPTDPEIARHAVEAIRLQLPQVWQDIRVVVRDGRITLEGEVPWNYQREQATSVVAALRGVRGVANLIRIKPQVAPLEIKHRIEDAFRRSSQVDANRIVVETDGDQVTLKGRVRSWAEREEALQTAWSAPGVAVVRNQIEIGP